MVRLMVFLTALALVCLALTDHALASTQDLAKQVSQAFDLDRLKQGDVEQRRKLAQAFLAYWNSFSTNLPRPSPDEAKWIEGELNSNQTERISAVINRREYGLWAANTHASSCVTRAQVILLNVGSNDAIEAGFWADFLNCIIDVDDLARWLQTAGLMGQRYDGPFYIAMFDVWRSELLNDVIVPMLLR